MPAAWLDQLGEVIDPPGAWPATKEDAQRQGISVLLSATDAASEGDYFVVRPDGSSSRIKATLLADVLANPQGHWILDV